MAAPSRRSPFLWTLLHAILWFAPLAAVSVIVPRFERIFVDYGIDLTASTLWAIRISHMLVNLMVVVVAALIVLLAVDFAAIRHFGSRPDGRSTRLLWIAIMTILPLSFAGFVATAIALPWATLDYKLSG